MGWSENHLTLLSLYGVGLSLNIKQTSITTRHAACVQFRPDGVCTVLFFGAEIQPIKTWFSATLDFSLVFPWFSAVYPTLCTVVYKKTKTSCFGGFFSLVWQLLGLLGVVYMLK